MLNSHFLKHIFYLAFFMVLTGVVGCTQSTAPVKDTAKDLPNGQQFSPSGKKASAYFAGGCFWCVEADFEKLPGVYEAISGYSGGALQNPTYQDVSYRETGHLEAVEIVYDPQAIDFKQLVDFHLRHIDPTDDGGQFCDRGSSYKTAIFVSSEDEHKIAEKAIEEAATIIQDPIVTPIIDFEKFWIAEDYHQDYYKKNPIRYSYYRRGCGRDRRIEQIWQPATLQE